MATSKSNDISLAFVDVITNGLGGMLVLFFIVVLVQSQLEWTDQGAAAESTASRQSEPFVLIVQALNGATPFDPQATDSVWRFEGVPSDWIAERRGTQWDWGRSYAVVVSPRPLGLNARVLMRTPPDATQFQVEVYPAGAQKVEFKVESTPGTTQTEVWPALNSR